MMHTKLYLDILYIKLNVIDVTNKITKGELFNEKTSYIYIAEYEITDPCKSFAGCLFFGEKGNTISTHLNVDSLFKKVFTKHSK